MTCESDICILIEYELNQALWFKFEPNLLPCLWWSDSRNLYSMHTVCALQLQIPYSNPQTHWTISVCDHSYIQIVSLYTVRLSIVSDLSHLTMTSMADGWFKIFKLALCFPIKLNWNGRFNPFKFIFKFE